jgi:hypothetical protein
LQGTADECARRAMRHAGGRNASAPTPLFVGCRIAVYCKTRTARAGGDGRHCCTLPSAACDARQDRLSGAIPRGVKRSPTKPRSALNLMEAA